VASGVLRQVWISARRIAADSFSGRMDRPTAQRHPIAIAAYRGCSDSTTLLLRAQALDAQGHLRQATVVSESESEVVVAMAYDEYDCRCGQSMIGVVDSMTVQLQAPLGRRRVRDESTGAMVTRS